MTKTRANPYLNKNVLRQLAAQLKDSFRFYEFSSLVRMSRLPKGGNSRRASKYTDYRSEYRESFSYAMMQGVWAFEERFGAIPRSDKHLGHVLEAFHYILGDDHPLPSARSVRRWLADWEGPALGQDAGSLN